MLSHSIFYRDIGKIVLYCSPHMKRTIISTNKESTIDKYESLCYIKFFKKKNRPGQNNI